MITASEAREALNNPVDYIRTTESFKYVMDRIEKEVKNTLVEGKHEFSYTLYALRDHHGKYPTVTMRKAIEAELRANGYEYLEFAHEDSNNNVSWCFKVSW